MNSLNYFSSLECDESLALRADKLEEVYGVLRAGPNDKEFSTLSVSFGDGEEIDLGPGARVVASFSESKNVMIFCMGALTIGEGGVISGEKDGSIIFDERFLEFGDSLLFIRSPKEFFKRINCAFSKEAGVFTSDLFHDGFGLVEYKDLERYSGGIGLYIKDIEYSWQMEFRMAFGVEDSRLNGAGAFEFNVGDLSDITQIIPLQDLIDAPMVLRRRVFSKSGGKYKEIDG